MLYLDTMEKLEILKTDFLEFTTYNTHEIWSYQYLDVKEPRAVIQKTIRILTVLNWETGDIKRVEKDTFYCSSVTELKRGDLNRAKEHVKLHDWKILKK